MLRPSVWICGGRRHSTNSLASAAGGELAAAGAIAAKDAKSPAARLVPKEFREDESGERIGQLRNGRSWRKSYAMRCPGGACALHRPRGQFMVGPCIAPPPTSTTTIIGPPSCGSTIRHSASKYPQI